MPDASWHTAAADGAFTYVSDAWQSTYIINTTRLGFREAEAVCQDNSGHLVSYRDLEEQLDVERYFVDNGYFIPAAHKFYWLGYMAVVWPEFQWLDPNTYAGYTHWGTYLPGESLNCDSTE